MLLILRESAGEFLESGNICKSVIPVGPARIKNMRGGRDANLTFKATRRHHQKAAFPVQRRQGGATGLTKAAGMAGARQLEGFYAVLAGQPLEAGLA